MNRKQKILVSVTGIVLVTLILLGLTYAYFLTQIKGNTNEKSISVTTAYLALKYDDGTPTILTSSNIVPDTIVGEKTFSVTNTGNGTVDSYAVVLENLKINYISGSTTYLEYPEDFKLEISCSSSVDDKTCNGYDDVMPSTNDILLTNSIDKDEVQTYTLKLTYVDSGANQSADMNKQIEAKINIIDTKGTVDLEGTVTNANTGDYVEVVTDNETAYTDGKNEIKLLADGDTEERVRSHLDKNGKYKVVGVKPGNYKVEIYKASNTTTASSSSNMTITKGDTASVDVTNKIVTITEDSRAITMDINAESGLYTLGEEIKEIGTTLKDTILASARKAKEDNSTTRTIFYDKTETLPTTPGEEISGENERVLGMTEDDYTASTGEYSYYFRGRVKDNYLEFNNMCWRIVRIEGDGSVKITLAAEKKCSEITENDTGSAFIGLAEYGYKKIDPGIETYREIYAADYVGSTNGMRSTLNAWLNGIDFTSATKAKIKGDNWCIGNMRDAYSYKNGSITEIEIVGTVDEQHKMAAEYGEGYFFYSTHPKVNLYSNYLLCDSTGLDGEIDRNAKIGTLTAGEIILAGGKITTDNQYYLADNASNAWLTLSLFDFDSGYAPYASDMVMSVVNGHITVCTNEGNDSTDCEFSSYVYGGGQYVRPAITLIKGIKLASDSGDGTINSPYKVVES